MADTVVRKDVVQVSFETDLKSLKKLVGSLDDIKKSVGGIDDNDAFKKLKEHANQTVSPLKKVAKQLTNIGKKAGTAAFKALKKVASVSFKALAVGITAAATAIGALVKNAVTAYAEYEQLYGGMQTLLGAKGAKTVEEYAKLTGKSVSAVKGEYSKLVESEKLVMKNANNAFKTAGMSANEYMETITSFSAALTSSLGGDTVEAAKLADTAIKDMADNANKMGTPLENVSTVYSNLARGMYMTLDNLKLGYAGTKEGAKQLVNDAAKIDKSVKSNDLSYANLVRAIHAVQVKMDIYGTTSKEAFGTIQGSLSAFKAAWGNLMPAMIQGGDELDRCIDNLVESIVGFKDEATGEIKGGLINNLVPAIEKALGGVGVLIERLAPILEDNLPKIIEMLLPPLIRAAAALFSGLLKSLPSIVKAIVKEIPFVFKEIGTALTETFGEQFPAVKKFGEMFNSIGEFCKKNSDKIKKIVPVLLGVVGALIAFNKIKSIGSMFSGLFGGSKGGSGGGLFSGLASLAKMKTKSVLKGVANIGIVLVAVGALTALLFKVAPAIAKMSDMKSILKVAATMVILGIVGTALSKFAGIAGKLKVMTVLKGIANIALSLVAMGALSFVLVKLLPYFGTINIPSILKLAAVMLILGVLGTALTVFAGIAGLIPIPVVLAGLANIALVINGFGLLVAEFAALNQIQGFKTFMESGGELLTTLFKILGECVGSIVGGVLEGITNSLPAMGENVAGFINAIAPALKSVSGIDTAGFGEFLTSLGGFLLMMTANDILSFFTGGTDWSGISEGLNTLAGEGTKKFFTFVGSLSPEAINNASLFFTALDGISSLPNVGGLGQLFTGENDFSGVASGLGKLGGTEVKKFFAFVGEISETQFANTTKFFKALDGIGALPNAGGVAQWFSGTNDFGGTATGLGQLASDGVKNFFNMVASIDELAFTNAGKMFQSLNDIGNIPNTGGLAQWFSGENDFTGTAEGLSAFFNKGKGFFDGVKNIQGLTFGVVEKMVWAIKKMKEVKKQNVAGIYEKAKSVSAFFEHSGTFTDGVKNIQGLTFGVVEKMVWGVGQMQAIKNYDVAGIYEKAKSVSAFFEHSGTFIEGVRSIQGLTFGVIEKMAYAVGEMAKIASYDLTDIDGKGTAISNFMSELKGAFETDIGTVVDNAISNIVKKISELPKQMGRAIKNNGNALTEALVSIWKDAVKATTKPVNKLISGANWILEQFGSEKRVASWTPYAKGTDGHKGGNALVNDGRGAELVQMPNGNTFIPQGRNVFMPNAPKGMKVLSAERTAQVMGKSSPTFRYAKGTGDIDIWSYLDNASGLINAVSEKYVNYDGVKGIAKHFGKGMVSTISGEMTSWADKLFDEMGVLSLANYVASAGVEQWRSTVIRALKMEGLYSAANVERTLMQMQTESGGNPYAINLWDSNAKKGTPSKGLMQVIDPTFRAYARAGFNTNIYDPLSNILASIRYAVSRYGSLARAYRGVGYGNGGIVTKPTWGVFGEEGAEANIPLTKSKRKQGIGLWAKAGEMLGMNEYTPEADGAYYETNSVENNTYSPQFTINISGTTDDRAMARKVKRWIAEAWEEMLSDYESKSPRTQEI